MSSVQMPSARGIASVLLETLIRLRRCPSLSLLPNHFLPPTTRFFTGAFKHSFTAFGMRLSALAALALAFVGLVVAVEPDHSSSQSRTSWTRTLLAY